MYLWQLLDFIILSKFNTISLVFLPGLHPVLKTHNPKGGMNFKTAERLNIVGILSTFKVKNRILVQNSACKMYKLRILIALFYQHKDFIPTFAPR